MNLKTFMHITLPVLGTVAGQLAVEIGAGDVDLSGLPKWLSPVAGAILMELVVVCVELVDEHDCDEHVETVEKHAAEWKELALRGTSQARAAAGLADTLVSAVKGPPGAWQREE